jgi:putative FmdB family regulatory protein
MPTHEYNCEHCKRDYEYFHLRSDDLIPKCPTCGSAGDPNKRLPPKNTGLQFKGSGFYVNDYKKRGR